MEKIETIFIRNRIPVIRFTLAFIVAIALLVLDHRGETISSLKYTVERLLVPVRAVAYMPNRLHDWSQDILKSRSALLRENQSLKDELLILSSHVQKNASLVSENIRLRELFNSSKIIRHNVMVAEVIGVDSDPFLHKIVLNHGADYDVTVGQPVLDQNGLMGQVVHVGPVTSTVLLISDITHATPVQVNRNGLRAIAVGSGYLNQVSLIHVPDTADIREGDLLISSGLGGRFPSGYPVAEVSEVKHDPGQPFALVSAKPKAYLGRRRHVLIVKAEISTSNNIASQLVAEPK